MARSPLTASPGLLAFLKTLHTQSTSQESTMEWKSLPAQCTDAFNAIMRDKFIALDQDKCELVYNVLRSTNARNVVEAGTSFGVRTIYLALAVAQNVARGLDVGSGAQGRVIPTENEYSKAEQAQNNWAQAGTEIEGVIELRVGDLRETLSSNLGAVDFLLLDIWTPLALPALKMFQAHLRAGSVIMVDNTLKPGGV